jgi:hypothetical protein
MSISSSLRAFCVFTTLFTLIASAATRARPAAPPPSVPLPGSPLEITWTNNILTVKDPRLPQGRLEILHLEAFCRPGAWTKDWSETKIPHTTRLVAASADRKELQFVTRVEPDVEVIHSVRSSEDALDFRFEFINHGASPADIQWFQPACVRVAAFTGCGQSNYTRRSFVFGRRGPVPLDSTFRTEEARYRGGQVFLPPWTQPADANPRPIAGITPANGLIFCRSADDQWLLAIASDRTHELFEGVYTCLHSDPLVGGLKPGESKRIRQVVYLLENNAELLRSRYERDFHPTKRKF